MLGQSPRQLRAGAWGWEVSPDGTKIAFSPSKTPNEGYREIWLMDSEGANAEQVLTLGAHEKLVEQLVEVHWSPDGQRIGFIRQQLSAASSASSAATSIESCDLKGAKCAGGCAG